ncbi:unnamed protein product, partial [Symbiodinium pilosum]
MNEGNHWIDREDGDAWVGFDGTPAETRGKTLGKRAANEWSENVPDHEGTTAPLLLHVVAAVRGELWRQGPVRDSR